MRNKCPRCDRELDTLTIKVPLKGFRPDLPNTSVNVGESEFGVCNGCGTAYVESHGVELHTVKAVEV